METTNKEHIAGLVEMMAQNGITHVVISPGSRNAPLTIAFDAHPSISHTLIHDERVAAFYALGLAEGLGKPVAICCTSGSAVLNYAPAVVEAYYRQIPLLVLTADRPSLLIDQGDGQCMRQDNVYDNYVKASFKLPEESMGIDILEDSREIAGNAIFELTAVPQGPVHLNIPLHEPLYGVVPFEDNKADLKIKTEVTASELSDSKLSELTEIWQNADKKLIIIGQLSQSDHLKPVLEVLAQQNSVSILVENTSNLQNFYKYNHCIDRSLATISESEIRDFKPDLVLSIGGAIVSKKIKAFLRKNAPAHNWRVGQYLIDEDTFLSKTENIEIPPEVFMQALARLDEVSFSNYAQLWKAKDFKAMEKHQTFLASAPFSDLVVTDYILDTLPDGAILQMANSSVVRYCQLFNPIQGMKYFANRGVSGIDGSTSTAVGMAISQPNNLVTLITGDISFFYDSNGLWLDHLPENIRIFLINNNGGGIFNILEGSRKSVQNKLFVAPHKAKASSICEAFGVDYNYCDSLEALESQMHDFYSRSTNKRPKLVEVDTAESANHEILMAYFEALK